MHLNSGLFFYTEKDPSYSHPPHFDFAYKNTEKLRNFQTLKSKGTNGESAYRVLSSLLEVIPIYVPRTPKPMNIIVELILVGMTI